MYINGILLGVLATVFVEMALVLLAIGCIAVSESKKGKKKPMSK